ncbi:hypothetical protein [Candidatus Methanodesulfokora washburnensis]|uniref:Uncharacterized protein n=1 Tax=Candidatus Methanodesulfokora washburnensis TaxID=2478471 RepID=A0A3R9PUF2_9CREN|nr:hypothetical protein [Candidatus Methanodesulfokores washburnensis]RSN73363.1 hypothetical protein D6D85_10625 [Candidatus Methanodesulfokores washburnensis]
MSLVYEIVDQRDIQKKTKARYPSAVVVAKLLKIANAKTVLDVTYGRGRFYKWEKPQTLIGVDPKLWKWIVEPDIFYQMTVFRFCREIAEENIKLNQVDVVVIDPPAWNYGIRYNKRDEYAYIIGTPQTIIEQGLKAARLLNSRYLLLHFNKMLDLGEKVYIIQFRWFAHYLYTENKNKSYYILYKLH